MAHFSFARRGRVRKRWMAVALCAASTSTLVAGAGTGASAAAPPSGSDQSHGSGVVVTPTTPVKKKETRPRPPRPADGVIGGIPAPPGAYPWFTSIQTQSGFAFCGGTLVSSRWVLTAAHCVDSASPANLRLVIGSNQVSQPQQGEVRGVSQIIVNPAWNPANMANDVALLRLDNPSTKPWARLARAGDATAPGQIARAIGHGATSEGGPQSDILMEVDLPVQSDATMSQPSVYGSAFIGPVMIGAGPLAGGKDTCQGDSGGPLFVAGAVQSPLVGDTSWGHGCARPDRPGVYGEVYQGAMRAFVDSHVTRPANDDFAGQVITGAVGKVAGSNTDATGQPGEQVGAGNADTTVWYTWTAPVSGRTTMNLREAQFDTTLGVFTGNSVASLTAVATNDDYGSSLQSKVTFNAVAGRTYRIVVDGFAAAHGPFRLQWAQLPPANDDFANGRPLPGLAGIVSASSFRSTGEPGELDYHGGAIADNSVWFRWTPTAGGPAVVRLGGIASSFSPGMAIYTGSLGSLTKVAEGASSVSLNVVAGRTYHIAVDGNGGSTGAFTLEWLLARCNGLNATIIGKGPIAGTAGNDVIVGSAGADSISAGGGNDTICALGGNDVVTGGLGADREFGGIGNDTFWPGAAADGADLVDGQVGVDVMHYGARTAPLTVTLNGFAGDGVAGEGDNVLSSVENVVGGSAGDRITGSAVANVLSGRVGNDVLRGGAGNDSLAGGPGADALFGDAANDALNLVDGVRGNDRGDGGLGVDTASRDALDVLVNVP